jgi:IclR family transcriptional regulator, pca regulon regulatory protein
MAPRRSTSPAPRPATGSDKETIAGLARGLAVIRAFSVAGTAGTLTEIANITGLSPAATRRCLHTLEDLGYAGRVGRQFFLRPRVLDLSAPYLNGVNTETLASDYLQEVVAASGHSSSLAVLDDVDIVYLAHAGVRRVLRIEASTGTRYPAYATSLGRVLLGNLADDRLRELLVASEPKKLTRRTVTDLDQLMAAVAAARDEGYALVEDQLAIGVMSIAVPVRNQKGDVVAAINCSAQSGDVTEKALKRFLPVLQETSARITNAIRYFPALTQTAATKP